MSVGVSIDGQSERSSIAQNKAMAVSPSERIHPGRPPNELLRFGLKSPDCHPK